MPYLLDTNTISEPVKKHPDRCVIEKIRKNEDGIFIAAPVLHELYFGMNRLPESKKKQGLRFFIEEIVVAAISILPYDENAAKIHAVLRADLMRKGLTPSFVDGQIAAIAIHNNFTLVTRNMRDFQQYEELKLECWHGGD